MMKQHVLALVVVGLVSIATPAQGQPWSEPELAGAVDALVQPEAAAGLLSGTLLIAEGERILIQRSYGRPARGDVEMILYLVSKGADPKGVNRERKTMADMANGPRIQPCRRRWRCWRSWGGE
jgi:hypothetical protein